MAGLAKCKVVAAVAGEQDSLVADDAGQLFAFGQLSSGDGAPEVGLFISFFSPMPLQMVVWQPRAVDLGCLQDARRPGQRRQLAVQALRTRHGNTMALFTS